MASSEHVIWLQDCTGDCLDLVGGKARSLGALLAHDFQVPPGFVLSTHAYREHVQHNGLAESIETSEIHLDILTNLKRISSHVSALAISILEEV